MLRMECVTLHSQETMLKTTSFQVLIKFQAMAVASLSCYIILQH